MNSRLIHSIKPTFLYSSLLINRSLITALVKRDVVGRYRGSVMGLLWSFFNPVIMLAVYTFVFSVVFKARWSGGSETKTEFALVLFSGLLIFNLLSECLNRAPGLIVGNINYVKKVIFPLEILPIVAVGSALFHFLVGLVVWFIFYLIFFGIPNIKIFLLPLIVLPLLLMALGFSWLLASIGVYLRDVSQVVVVMTTILMFLSPVFYPVASLSEKYRGFLQLNPLTFYIEQARDVMIWGRAIRWGDWLKEVIISAIIFWLGYAWFQKTRKGFADVL